LFGYRVHVALQPGNDTRLHVHGSIEGGGSSGQAQLHAQRPLSGLREHKHEQFAPHRTSQIQSSTGGMTTGGQLQRHLHLPFGSVIHDNTHPGPQLMMSLEHCGGGLSGGGTTGQEHD
jgi:hypothetical protein